jgi:hypothetical protein
MAGVLIDPVVNIPILIEQGDSPSWLDNPFSDAGGVSYDSTLYTLTYTLAGPTAPLTVAGVVTGSGWQTNMTPAQTAALTPGTYWWQAVLAATGFSLTAARGELTVVANLALQPAGYSGLSQNEQNYQAAQQLLANTTATESYKIATREMRFRMTADIIASIAYWNIAVINERTQNSISQNQGNPRKLYARFPGRNRYWW